MKTYLSLTFYLMMLLGCSNRSTKEKPPIAKRNTIYVKNAHAMVYHTKEEKTYLFGGADDREVLSDLWVLDSIRWRKVAIKYGPEPRTFAALVYDSTNERLVLFGGSKVLFGKGPDPKNLLNDTWQYQNGKWKKLLTSKAPSPRAEAVMVYDENRKTIILFGGYQIQNGEYLKLGDTWEFYDNNWHLASKNGPSERHGVSMAYNPKDQSVVLFGGSTIDKQYGESKGETWKWNSKEWTKLSIEQPTGIFNAPMVYDKKRGGFIRFGGWNGKTRIDETWLFNKNEWQMLELTESPSPRNHSAMVYDQKNHRILLFGGHNGEQIFGDTWEFTDHRWKKVLDSKPSKRIPNGH